MMSGRTSDWHDSVMLPPLCPSRKASSIGLRQMKLPGGADTWTDPQASLKPRPARFREYVASAGLDLEREAAVWDTNREMKALQPKFQSAFKARSSVASSRRPKSALTSILSAAYLGKASEQGDIDLASSIAAEMAEAASVTTTSENLRLQHELAQIRTGDDAVKFFARHGGNSKIKVLFCNLADDEDNAQGGTCNLTVVPETLAKPEHYTISANGVFHVCPGEMSECTPLSVWMHHGMLHSVLKSMPFFKHFTYQKNFQHWRTNARYEAYCRQRQKLSNKCFLAKPMFVGPLAKVHKLVTDVQELPLLSLSQESQRLHDFRATQLEVSSNPNTGAHAQLERKQDVILDVLADLVAKVQQVLAGMSIANTQDQGRGRAKSKSIVQEKQEAREKAKRLQMAERDVASLRSFIKLTDYMLQGARVACVHDAALAFAKRLGNGHRMFTVDAHFERDGVVLSPSREDFSREMSRVWDGALQAVLVPALASSQQFKKYFLTELRQEQTVEKILNGCQAYRAQLQRIDKAISDQFCAAEAGASEAYMHYHHIYNFGERWDGDDFSRQVHTFESLSAQIQQMNDFKAELSSFRLNRAFGAIHVNGVGLRSTLEPVPEQALVVMMRSLASLAHQTCLTTTQQLTISIKSLDERPATPQSVENFEKLCGATHEQLERSSELKDDLEDAWRLLLKQGYRISMEDQLLVEVLRARRKDLEDKLTQARAYLANLDPDVVVTVSVNALEADVHEWSLTCTSVAGKEMASVKMDVEEEISSNFKDSLAERLGVPTEHLQLVTADGQLLDEANNTSAEEPLESIASLLRRQGQASGLSPSTRRGTKQL